MVCSWFDKFHPALFASSSTCHPVGFFGSRQIVFFAMVRLSELKKIFKSEELTDALPDWATRHQAVSSVVHQQEFVNVVRHLQSEGNIFFFKESDTWDRWKDKRHFIWNRSERDWPVSTGSDTRRRVTGGIVLHGSCHVTPQLCQIWRQLNDSVDGANKNITCPSVNGEVSEGSVKRPVHHPARQHRGRRWSSWGRQEKGRGDQQEK